MASIDFKTTPPAAWTLRHPSGAFVEILEQGAHIIQWQTASGRQVLYVSPTAEFTEEKPVRGGIPVCFPQFSDMGDLGQHGFARVRKWEVKEKDEANSRIVLRLGASVETLAVWKHDFEVEYEIVVEEERLHTNLRVKNCDKDQEWPLTCALHTYFAVSNISHVALGGLQGLTYLDNPKGREAGVHDSTEPAFTIDQEVDRIYLNAPDRLTITDTKYPAYVAIEKRGFPDAVVWNPWVERAQKIADLPDTDYEKFVCVEVADIRGKEPAAHIVLKPGDTWEGGQTLSIAAQGPSLGE